MPVVDQSPLEEKKSKEESTAVKKKRKRESKKGELEPKSNSQENLKTEATGAVSKERDSETTRSLVKKRKVGKVKLGGNNEFDGDLSSVSEKMAYDLKKRRKETKKDAIELEELGDGSFVRGEMNDGSVSVSEYKMKVDKKKRKKGKKKADKDTMELEEPDNVDIGEGDDGRVVRESEKFSVILDEVKQDDMPKGEDKKRKGKKKKKESGNVAQVAGQNTLAVGDVKSGKKEREKSKDKNKAGETGKKKVAQQKAKGKRVSFTDAVEVFGDDADDEESNEGGVDGEESDQDSESKLVHGKWFTPEEDATLMEALLNYAEMKQLGEKGLEMIRESAKHPELRGCWAEIAKALPHRPPVAVYKRARILLYRDDERKWTEEEYMILREFVEKNGPNWVKLAALLGKSDIHVKDAWRRIKPKNLKSGHWTQEEYQNLFDLVNLDLRVKAHQQYNHGHRTIRENIAWGAISDKLITRRSHDCCIKWYRQLASPLVKQGVWSDTDDYLLVGALQKVDVVCLEDVDWDNLLDHRSGELCRQRWNQMVRHLGGHRERSFIEQVEVLSRRYTLEMLDSRKGEGSDLPPTTPSAPTLDG